MSIATGTGTSIEPHTATLPAPFPGEVLREDFMEPLGLSVSRLAHAIGVSPAAVAAIIKGKRAIKPEMALRLGRYTGTSAEFWSNLQTIHDLRTARIELEDEINRTVIPLREAA